MDALDAEMARRGLVPGGAAIAPAADEGDPIAREMARRGLSADPGTSFSGEAKAILSGPNSVIANIGGFPVDAANWLLNQVGLGSEKPFGGSASIRSGMNALGIATDETPQTGAGRVAKRVAEELTTAPLMMMGASALGPAVSAAASGGGFLSRFAQNAAKPVLEAFTANPGTQLLASGGAGVGGGLAREIAPDSGAADMAGSLIGGFVGSAIPSAARYAWDTADAITAPFRENGRQAIVGRALQRSSGSGENLGLAIDDAVNSGGAQIVPGSAPTTAQLLRDDGLAATERGLRSDPQVTARFAQRSAEQSAARAGAIDAAVPKTSGSAPAVKAAVEDRVRQFTEFADDIVARTEDDVRRRVTALGPATDPEVAGAAIREAIQGRRDALAAIRERATRPLYDEARAGIGPVDVSGPVGVLNDALRTAKGDIATPLERARANFFVRGTQTLDTTPDGLMGTRQSLTALLADPTVAPHSKTIIRDAQRMLDDAIEASSPTFKEANRVYRELSIPITRMDERLSGDVLRTNPALARTGGPAYEMPDSAVPGKFLRRGAGAPEAAREMAEVTAASPDAQNAIVGRLATSLRDYATKEDGTINPLRWRRWMADNRAALDQSPQLRQQMESLQSAQGVIDSLVGRQTRTLADMQRGSLGFLLKQDPAEAVGSILGSKSATQEMERLMGVIRRDPDATAALRRAVIDHGWKGAQSAGAVDSMNNAIVSTDKFLRFIKDNGDALAVAFQGRPQQLSQIERIAEDMQRSNWSNIGGRVAGSNTSQNLTTANIIGAIFRGTVSPTNVPINASAGRVVQFLYRLPEARMQEMLVDAMLNPEIAQAMLRPVTPYNLDNIIRPLSQRLLATTAITSTRDRQDRPGSPTEGRTPRD